jgi:flavodoxin
MFYSKATCPRRKLENTRKGLRVYTEKRKESTVSHCLLAYSSVTGNTRMVAETILRVLPPDTIFQPVRNAPSPEGFDLIVIGFWTHKGGPDPAAARYMQTIRDRDVAFFGTLAAYPDSDHAHGVIVNAEALLAGNRICGSFLCQGKLAPERLAHRLSGKEADEQHPMTEERRIRLLEAARHPDKQDLALAEKVFRSIWVRHQTEKR